MKQAVFNKKGHASEVLEIKEVPTPEPKAGEVRIRVKAAPVNPSDSLFVQGFYGMQPRFPDSPAGFEGAGEIDVIGTGIGEGIQLAKGMKVCFAALGTWSEYVVVPATQLVPLPNGLSWEEGAQLFINPFTALAMLEEAKLQKGDWLLLTAGYSAVSKMVVKIAKERGIRTICTVRRDEQADMLHMMGAEAVINTKKDSFSERVRALTDKQGVKACFEAVGGETAEEALQCMSKGGKMIIYGLLSGKDAKFNSGLLIFKEITVKGFWLSRWMVESSLSTKAKLASELHSLVKKGIIPFDVGATFPLDQAGEAVTYSDTPGKSGKAIILC
ncbi:MAG: zinc-dependent alcohol dehydrogenase family protein [Cyclobacteriaceae bacterium]